MTKTIFLYLITVLFLGCSSCIAAQNNYAYEGKEEDVYDEYEDVYDEYEEKEEKEPDEYDEKAHLNNQVQKPVVKGAFQLPNREIIFIGRQKQQAAMVALFGKKRRKPCTFQVITGVGGVGKTHFALRYAHMCSYEQKKGVPRYNAVLWLRAGAGLDTQFDMLAKAWGKPCKTVQKAVQFVYKTLQKKHRALLVFDNTLQSQKVAPYLPPPRQKGVLDIIITTRNSGFDVSHASPPTYIRLEAFTQMEGRAYIQKMLGNKGCSQQAMDALCKTVSGLPLALNYALEYIAKGGNILAEYPARFVEHQLRMGTQLRNSPVVTSVLRSVFALQKEHPIIEPLLVYAAYLAPAKIPQEMLFTLLDAKVTKQPKEQALAALHMYGLLTRSEDGLTFDFHPLVQQVLCEWHFSEKGKAGREALLKDWIAYFKQCLAYDERNLGAIYLINPLIPHAFAVADADEVSAAIQKTQAELYDQIGRHQCFGMGHYDKAKQCYEKAYKIKVHHYGETHLTTAKTMENLGTVFRNLGNYPAAKVYLEKALKIQEKHYGGSHHKTAITMENLGNVLDDLGDYRSAQQYLEKALKIQEQHYGDSHPETASAMENMGIVLRHQGDYDQAKTYLEKALQINQHHYGPTHPYTAKTMINLGTLLDDLGSYIFANTNLARALKIQKQHYGDTHPYTALTMANLGTVLSHLGDYASAKTYYEKAVEINQARYGAHHPSTAGMMENLGNVLRNLDDYPSAKTYLERALNIHEKHYGEDHPSTARTMENLGTLLRKLGDYALAKQYLEKALTINKEHYGADHPSTAITMGNLGILCKNLGQYDRAREYYQQNIKVFTAHYGGNHPKTKRVKRNLAILEEHLAPKNNQKKAAGSCIVM